MENIVQKIPFLRITIALVAGIVLGNFFAVSGAIILFLLGLILLCLLFIQHNYHFRSNNLFGIGIHIFFLLLGIVIYQNYNRKPKSNEDGLYVATVLEFPQEKPNSFKSLLKVKAVLKNDSLKPVTETMLAYFEKNEYVAKLNAGEIILFRQHPQPIRNNGNPYEFDYKKYLERQKINRQVYLSANNWKITSEHESSIEVLAEQAREKLLRIYRNQHLDSTELQIISALTLGYKRDLDPETKRVFSNAGAMHVLAVSGLHVGIIFWLITLLFGFLRRLKSGRFLFVFMVLILLWTYAFITGLSPSVTRATLMFSIYLIGENLNRKANVYNSLAASAFLILVINPNHLFEIGFQLSYSAVFGIVYLQPKLSSLFNTENRVFHFIWTLFTVSLAAQIATSPFILYYFGQFPTYFWLTNTLIIPAVMILIPLGMALLLVSEIPVLASAIAFLLNYIIKFIYWFLSLIENFPFAVLQSSISYLQFFVLILTFITVLIYLNNKKHWYLNLSLTMLLLVFFINLAINISQHNKNELIVYNSAKNPSIQLIHGFTNYIISENEIKPDDYITREILTTNKKLKLQEPVYLTFSDTLKNNLIYLKDGVIFFEGKTILFRKQHNFGMNKITPDFCINPKFQSNSFSKNEKSQTIITNIRFKSEINSENYRFHNTTSEGAFRKNW